MRTGALEDHIRLALDLAGLVVLNQHVEDGRLIVHVAYVNDVAICPHCGRLANKIHDFRPQRKRGLPLHWRKVGLAATAPCCLRCLGEHRARVPSASPIPAVDGVGEHFVREPFAGWAEAAIDEAVPGDTRHGCWGWTSSR